MKRLVLLTFVFLPLLGFGQAKKPTIMVVPSDVYCISRGYKMTFDNQGTKQELPDYKKAMQNDSDLRLVITKMGQIMTDRGFPLKDLETEMKNLEKEAAEVAMMTSKGGSDIQESPIDKLKRTAKADIIMDLDFIIKQPGPRKYIQFNLRGLDAYTSKQIAGCAGDGQPSSAATPGLLLEEAVLSHMDGFNAQLQKHFEEMFQIGREVKVMIRKFASSDVDLESEVSYKGNDVQLIDIIDNWFSENCVQGRFTLSDASDNMARFEQVRIPMMGKNAMGKEVAMDTRLFVTGLINYLKKEFKIESKNYMRGLGEAWIILGEK